MVSQALALADCFVGHTSSARRCVTIPVHRSAGTGRVAEESKAGAVGPESALHSRTAERRSEAGVRAERGPLRSDGLDCPSATVAGPVIHEPTQGAAVEADEDLEIAVLGASLASRRTGSSSPDGTNKCPPTIPEECPAEKPTDDRARHRTTPGITLCAADGLADVLDVSIAVPPRPESSTVRRSVVVAMQPTRSKAGARPKAVVLFIVTPEVLEFIPTQMHSPDQLTLVCRGSPSCSGAACERSRTPRAVLVTGECSYRLAVSR